MSKFVKPLDHIFTRTKIAKREVAFGPFFLQVTSLANLISLTNLDGRGGGGVDKSERGTFVNILLNSSKYCKEILQVYFEIIQDYFACLNPEMNKVLWIQSF